MATDPKDWSEQVRRAEIEREEKNREYNQKSGINISFPVIIKIIKRLFGR